MVKVREVMHSITLVNSAESIRNVAKVMKKKDIGSVLVEENKDIVGIVTERDILNRVVAEGVDADKTPAAAIMTRNPLSIDAETDIIEAGRLMMSKNFRRLPVSENGKIIGIVTTKSLAKGVPFYLMGRR